MGVRWETERPSRFLRRKHRELHSIVIPAMARDLAKSTRDAIRRRTPIGITWKPARAEFASAVPSGLLRASIDMDKSGSWTAFNVYRWTIETGVEYAPYVEYGTRPHIIRPKNRSGYLAFHTGMGPRVEAKVVHHPGTRPVYMFIKGVGEMRPKAMLIMARYIRPWANDDSFLLRVYERAL